MQCVMGLSIQHLVAYTVLAMNPADDQLTSNAHLGVRKILENACNLLTCATMLSAHFLAARMLAIKLAQDETKPYKMPQPWAQNAMFYCVHAVQSQAILMPVIPVLNHESEFSMDEHWNLEESHAASERIVAMILSASHLDTMLMLYDDFNTVVGAVFTMQRPPSPVKASEV